MGSWLLPLVFSVSFLMTWMLRRYALKRNVMDIPNERSSHNVPTPRGGGVAIVFGFFIGLSALVGFDEFSSNQFFALLGSGGLVAIVGFCDDHGHIAARWRLFFHFIAAGLAVFCVGELPDVPLLGAELGWFRYLLVIFYLVWLLNLYNFMDGIDGLAGVEAATVCISGALLYGMLGDWPAALAPALLGAAAVGFLVWNFPPARIFMGDSGSGFIGMALGVLSLQAGLVAPQLFWAWVILLGVFIVDATFTLCRRILHGHKFYEAHRSHAYQFAARHYGRHLSVTLGVAVINLCWLTPIAFWVAYGGGVVVAMLLAYIPLLVLAYKYRAGLME
ncbi:MraY family glycosyltransferase [Aquipseudomonas ullengensis]